MANLADPVIENWYKDVVNNLVFKVVAIDDTDETIEVQYLDGDIGEYDKESWYSYGFVSIEAPEDWSAPYDDLEVDDLGYTDNDIHFNPDRDEMDFSDY